MHPRAPIIYISILTISQSIFHELFVFGAELSDAPKVWCGSHSATSCEACGIEINTCAGDCAWTNKTVTSSTIGLQLKHPEVQNQLDENPEAEAEFKCRLKTIMCGNYESVFNVFHKCGDCSPLGSEYCTDPSCTWISSTSLCRPKLESNRTRTATVALLHDLHPPKENLLGDDGDEFSLPRDQGSENIEQPAWFFQKLVITNGADTTFYGMNGHQYGYAGIQIYNKEEKKDKKNNIWNGKIMFSIWDPDIIISSLNLESYLQHHDKHVNLVGCGSVATCESNINYYYGRDDGKDDDTISRIKEDPLHLSQVDTKISGYTATIDTQIKTEEPFYFMTQASVVMDENHGLSSEDCGNFGCDENESSWIEYSGFVSSESTFGDTKFRYLATVRIKLVAKNSEITYTTPGVEREWWHHGLYSFIEQWEAKESFDQRSAIFGPAYVSGPTDAENGESFSQIASSEYSFDTILNHETVNAYMAKVEPNDKSKPSFKAIELSTGGNVEEDLVEESNTNVYYDDLYYVGLASGDVGDDDDGGIYTGINKDVNSFLRGKKRVNAWTRFNIPIGDKPNELIEFSNSMSCLSVAQFSQEIEECLDKD